MSVYTEIDSFSIQRESKKAAFLIMSWHIELLVCESSIFSWGQFGRFAIDGWVWEIAIDYKHNSGYLSSN
jgi:hypothetical protein